MAADALGVTDLVLYVFTNEYPWGPLTGFHVSMVMAVWTISMRVDGVHTCITASALKRCHPWPPRDGNSTRTAKPASQRMPCTRKVVSRLFKYIYV